MASKHCSSNALPLLLVYLFLLFSISSAVDVAVLRLVRGGDTGRMVGGRTEVQDVKSDKEVQEIGLFCVEEHNRHGGHLTFSSVVAAQRQVVSGIKYYLRITARDGTDTSEKAFDAVVVVKAWLRSRVLVSFTPAVDQRDP